MFYSAEILSMRKKGKLARCWLAAILGDRAFKKTVSNKTIRSIDVTLTCEEILKFVDTNVVNRQCRFSLYLGSLLVYGTVRLHKMQVTMFQDYLSKMWTDLNPLIMAHKRATRTRRSITLDECTLPQPPPMISAFENLQLKEDLHLLPEVDLETIKTFQRRGDVESPGNFGALTDEEFDFLLFNVDDFRKFDSPEKEANWPEEHRDKSEHYTTGPLGLSDALPAIGQSIIDDQLQRTPQKRGSTAINLDTPTKKLRRSLRPEMDAAAQDITAGIDRIDFQHPDEFSELPVNPVVQPTEDNFELPEDMELEPVGLPPADGEPAPAILPQDTNVETTISDGRLHLDPVEYELPRPTRSKRVRELKRIDEVTQLSDTEAGKAHCSNPKIHTKMCLIPPVPERKREMTAYALFKTPSTKLRCSQSVLYPKRWADKLIGRFASHIVGPFEAQIEDSYRTEEHVRAAEMQFHSATIEISKGPVNDTTRNATTKNETAGDPIAVEDVAMAEIMIPEETGDGPETSMIVDPVDITNEPVGNVNGIELNISERATVSIAKMTRSTVRPSVGTNGPSTSNLTTPDQDAFLPQNLRKIKKETRTSYERISNPEAIVDVTESPEYRRSQQSIQQSRWTKPELLAYLDVGWCDRRSIKFTDLSPPENTSKIDAATCFTMLLDLVKHEHVFLSQKKPFGEIYITKRIGGTR